MRRPRELPPADVISPDPCDRTRMEKAGDSGSPETARGTRGLTPEVEALCALLARANRRISTKRSESNPSSGLV